MASNLVNLMTNEQLKYLKEIYKLLEDVHLDKSKVYQMTIIDGTGRHEYLANREEYLEHIISVILDEFAETLPQLGI